MPRARVISLSQIQDEEVLVYLDSLLVRVTHLAPLCPTLQVPNIESHHDYINRVLKWSIADLERFIGLLRAR